MSGRQVISELVLEPGTGKAIELLKGQILRVEQVEGGQCADFNAFMTRQTTKPGDHVDLLALMDVLAVPNVCGADVMKTSNFALKPLKLTVFAATEADLAQVPKTPTLASQRTPKDFKNSAIKS